MYSLWPNLHKYSIYMCAMSLVSRGVLSIIQQVTNHIYPLSRAYSTPYKLTYSLPNRVTVHSLEQSRPSHIPASTLDPILITTSILKRKCTPLPLSLGSCPSSRSAQVPSHRDFLLVKRWTTTSASPSLPLISTSTSCRPSGSRMPTPQHISARSSTNRTPSR